MTSAMPQVTPRVTDQYRSIQTLVTDQLRAAIISGRFEPGQRLNQAVLANELGVSRMPVREALRVLEAEGLVELQPHRSAIVVSLREEDVEEMFGIRAMLESRAAELAAPRFTDATLTRLRAIYQEMEGTLDEPDGERWVHLNREFHRTISSACGWPRLRAMIDAHINALAPYLRMWDSSFAAPILAARKAKFHAAHGEILAAAESRDAERLSCLLSEHVLATAHELVAYFAGRRAAEHAEQLSNGFSTGGRSQLVQGQHDPRVAGGGGTWCGRNTARQRHRRGGAS